MNKTKDPHAQAMAKKRWKGKTKKQISEHIKMMNLKRKEKQLLTKS